ncbi:hypothetical protein VTO73DRAFT_3860 [Trametes versicolor]
MIQLGLDAVGDNSRGPPVGHIGKLCCERERANQTQRISRPRRYKSHRDCCPVLQQQAHTARTAPTLFALIPPRTSFAAMFARLPTVVAFASLAVLAVATPMEVKRGGSPPPPVTKTVTVTAPAATPTGGSCSTGPIQCCNSLESANSGAGSLLLGLLGIVVQGLDVVLGLDCSPISVIGVGGGSCNSNVVCCEDNSVVRTPCRIQPRHLLTRLVIGRPDLHWLCPDHPLRDEERRDHRAGCTGWGVEIEYLEERYVALMSS